MPIVQFFHILFKKAVKMINDYIFLKLIETATSVSSSYQFYLKRLHWRNMAPPCGQKYLFETI